MHFENQVDSKNDQELFYISLDLAIFITFLQVS